MTPSQSDANWQALLADARAQYDHKMHRQLLGNDAERALERLRSAYVNDQITIETYESVVGDIIHGRPVLMPIPVRRRPTRSEVR